MKRLLLLFMVSLFLCKYITVDVFADPMDPLENVEVVTQVSQTEPPPNVVLAPDPNKPSEPTTDKVEDADDGEELLVDSAKEEIKNRKESMKKQKTKRLMDSIFWGIGIFLILGSLLFLTVYVLGATAKVGSSFFIFLTRHEIKDVNPLGYILRCLITGIVGCLCAIGYAETLILQVYSWLYTIFVKG